MLAPRDTATRERKSLDGLWRFTLDAAGAGRDEGWQYGLPAGTREMPVARRLQRRLSRAGDPRPASRTAEYQAELLAMSHRVFDRVDAVAGEQVWNFADFATTSGIMRVDGNKKGVFTRDRRPKASAYQLRRRWRGLP